MEAQTQPVHGASRSRGLEGGKVLAGLGALLLVVSLFLDWYGASDQFGGEAAADLGVSAWTVFELIDLLLAALAIATLVWAVAGFARSGRQLLPARFGAVAGVVALTLVLVSLLNEPPLLSGADPSREIGIWLALAGAVLITVGALLTTARISLVIASREREPHSYPDQGAPHEAQTETRPFVDDPARRARRG